MKAPLIAFVLFTSSNVALAEYYIPDFITSRLGKLTDNDRVRYKFNGLSALHYLYNSNTANVFSGISNLETVDKYGYLQVNSTNYGEKDGQCVSFVKAVAKVDKPTRNWRPGTQVGVGYILPGTAVALFKGDTYAYHTGIYMGIQDGHMYLLDQNWEADSELDLGYVSFHPIKLKTKITRGNGDVNNAYSYFTIR